MRLPLVGARLARGSSPLSLSLFPVLAHADDVSKNFLLIRDYQRRPYMSERMSKLVDDVNYFQNAVTSHKTRQQLAVPLFSVCTAGALMCFAPWIADEFGMSAGVFLAVLTATQNMGHEAETLFAALLQIQLAISALLKICARTARQLTTGATAPTERPPPIEHPPARL